MENLSNFQVVQANELIRQTNWQLSKTPIKLFKTLVSCLDTNNPPADNTVKIEKRQLVKLLDTDLTNYDYLKAQLKRLITSVKVLDNDEVEHFCALVTDIIWEKNNDYVSVTFHKDVMPYLLVSSNFLKYPVDIIPQFNSKYGLILFENLYSREKQYHYGNYSISVSELRWITGTTEQYKTWVNFETRVIKTAVNDINNVNAPILVKYRKIKKGRSIDCLQFYVRKRTSAFETDYDTIYRPEWL